MLRTLEERFWEKVDKRADDECWPWLGCRIPSGHGQFRVGDSLDGAHRMSVRLAGGDPSKGDVHHLCGNPPCVNPSHLEVMDRELHGRLHLPIAWTEEKIVTAIQGFAQEFGRPPSAAEWNPSRATKLGWHETVRLFSEREWPHQTTVSRRFGTWNAAIRAAGLRPRMIGAHGCAYGLKSVLSAV